MHAPLSIRAVREVLTRRMVGAAAVTTAVVGAVGIDAIQIPNLGTTEIVVTMLPSGVLAAIAIWLALKVENIVLAVVATVALCAIAGCINSPASFFFTALVRDDFARDDGGIVGGTVLAALFGAMFALPLGLMFGLAFAGPVAYVHWLRRHLSIEGPDRAALVSSALAFVTGSFAWVVSTGIFHQHPGTGLGPTLALPPAVPLALVVVSAVAFVCFGARLVFRRRWITRVRNGRVPGWAIVAANEVDTTIALDEVFPLAPSSRTNSDAYRVLIEVHAAGDDGAYRKSDHRLPRARIAA